MNAVAIENVPRGNEVDTFGGLRRETETIAQAVARLERKPNYTKVIATDEGQRLLAAAANEQASGRRQATLPPKSRIQSVVDNAPANIAALTGETALACVGSNHVPGHSRGCLLFVEPTAPVGQLLEISLDLIDIGENVRRDAGDLEGLASSIVELGVQQPVTVTPAGERYTLLLGQRRVLASRQAKLPTIRAIVVADPAELLTKPGARRASEQLAENRVRLAMNPVDEAVALRAILDADRKLTQAALAKRIGMSEPWIASTLALLKQPAEVQEFVRTDKLSIAHAKAIAGLPAENQVRLAKGAVTNSVSAHSLEQTAKYERQDLAGQQARKKLNEDAGKRALAALEAAGTPKDVRLFVFAEDYRIRDEEVRKVVKAAGFNVDEGWARGGERWAKCDCTALELKIRDGKGSTVSVVCVSDTHRRELEKIQNAARNEKAAKAEAERKALAKAVAAAMPKDLHPTIGRLILKVLDGYYGKAWSEYSKMSDASVVKAIVERLTMEQALRGSSFNGDSKSVPLKTLIKELGGADEAATAPELPSGRKPGKAKAATS